MAAAVAVLAALAPALVAAPAQPAKAALLLGLLARLDALEGEAQRLRAQVGTLAAQHQEQSRTIAALLAARVPRGDPAPLFRQPFPAAVNRTFLSKARDSVSIRDFGAVCSGDPATDDSPAIQAALDSGASRVEFPAGTCMLRRTVTVAGRAGLVLVGSGVFQTILQGPGGEANTLELVNRTSRVRLSDMTLHGNDTRGAALHIASTTVRRLSDLFAAVQSPVCAPPARGESSLSLQQ